jgi:hypothetical protein
MAKNSGLLKYTTNRHKKTSRIKMVIQEIVPLTEFTCFPDLPEELRLHIWGLTERVPRLVTMRTAKSPWYWQCHNAYPPQAYVCSEARCEILRFYTLLDFSDIICTKNLQRALPSNRKLEVAFDLEKDTLILDWDLNWKALTEISLLPQIFSPHNLNTLLWEGRAIKNLAMDDTGRPLGYRRRHTFPMEEPYDIGNVVRFFSHLETLTFIKKDCRRNACFTNDIQIGCWTCRGKYTGEKGFMEHLDLEHQRNLLTAEASRTVLRMSNLILFPYWGGRPTEDKTHGDMILKGCEIQEFDDIQAWMVRKQADWQWPEFKYKTMVRRRGDLPVLIHGFVELDEPDGAT